MEKQNLIKALDAKIEKQLEIIEEDISYLDQLMGAQ